MATYYILVILHGSYPTYRLCWSGWRWPWPNHSCGRRSRRRRMSSSQSSRNRSLSAIWPLLSEMGFSINFLLKLSFNWELIIMSVFYCTSWCSWSCCTSWLWLLLWVLGGGHAFKILFMLLHSSESLHLCLVVICTSSPFWVSKKSPYRRRLCFIDFFSVVPLSDQRSLL